MHALYSLSSCSKRLVSDTGMKRVVVWQHVFHFLSRLLTWPPPLDLVQSELVWSIQCLLCSRIRRRGAKESSIIYGSHHAADHVLPSGETKKNLVYELHGKKDRKMIVSIRDIVKMDC
jgi:hypothetical protein